ncbi:peptidoglycan editing factor PgeF [soil metagenome]
MEHPAQAEPVEAHQMRDPLTIPALAPNTAQAEPVEAPESSLPPQLSLSKPPTAFDPDWLVPQWTAQHIGAVMTTRRGGFSAPPFDSMNLRDAVGDNPITVAQNQSTLAQATAAKPVYLNQVHGITVARLTRADTLPGAPIHTADASITTEPGIACIAQVADCLQVLFAAPNGNAVGAAHAGWRGLAAGVLEATLRELCEAANCTPGEVQAWLGACIGPRHFEVGADVLEAFGARPLDLGSNDEPDRVARFVPHAPGKWLANLPLLARDRLRAAGVTQISGGEWCTVADPSRFFSYRRDRITGRMAAAIWIVPGAAVG